MLQYRAAVSLCYNNAGEQRVKISTRFQNKRKRKVTQTHRFIMLTNNLVFQQVASTQDFSNSFKSLYLMLVKWDQ